MDGMKVGNIQYEEEKDVTHVRVGTELFFDIQKHDGKWMAEYKRKKHDAVLVDLRKLMESTYYYLHQKEQDVEKKA